MKGVSEQLNGAKVEKYRYIDRMNEGICFIEKEPDETIQYVREDFGDHIECHLVHRNYDETISKIVKVSELETIIFEKPEVNRPGK